MESNKAISIQTLFNEDLIFDSGLNVPNINASRTYQQMENKTDSDICIKDLFEEFCLCDSVACLDTNNIQRYINTNHTLRELTYVSTGRVGG